jgi:hypothetical protein
LPCGPGGLLAAQKGGIIAVAPVDPGGAAADHLGVDVLGAGVDPTDLTAVAVRVLHHDPDRFPESEVRQSLPGTVAVGQRRCLGIIMKRIAGSDVSSVIAVVLLLNARSSRRKVTIECGRMRRLVIITMDVAAAGVSG